MNSVKYHPTDGCLNQPTLQYSITIESGEPADKKRPQIKLDLQISEHDFKKQSYSSFLKKCNTILASCHR